MLGSLLVASTLLPFVLAGELWQPIQRSRFQIVLNRPMKVDPQGNVSPDATIFDIDLFDNDPTTIATLKGQGKKTICYFSAGTYEPYRPDSRQFQRNDMGARLPEWRDEKWLDVNSQNVRKIMANRIQLAADKGCDGVDPDNMDGYTYRRNGVSLRKADTVKYMRFLSTEAEKRGLSIGLKNALDIVEDVLPFTQFAVNEQCAEYKECDAYQPFLDAGKPVFHIEYPKAAPRISGKDVQKACEDRFTGSSMGNFSTVLKNWDLDGWAAFCDGSSAETAVL
ncbi:hypothetical protein P152DRAFT_407863 [Eremomyces bilateralis CBS 781.70]|uniref:alpha-galactosidase n=1 Tax=Eremomyces bilateralis CBS 781.70 TaxID=1392243 RepID=A0A6G1GGU4_9PEZI|nr:uncharacterized protein P152DRAFT_407863 [Eremomyces bilateralis CBS 781.70]KAF1817327.1 hypothetical protein P152DRAFT_407863 [Eremomyces bilateralis CBS 781.70]